MTDLFIFGVIGFALLLFTCLVDIALARWWR